MFGRTAKHGTRNRDPVGLQVRHDSCEKLLPCGSRHRMIERVLRDGKEAEEQHHQQQPELSIAHTHLSNYRRIGFLLCNTRMQIPIVDDAIRQAWGDIH